jgi:hypothetical protein
MLNVGKVPVFRMIASLVMVNIPVLLAKITKPPLAIKRSL